MSSLTILEVVLENFMSYEYARVPLSRGLNLICGPNGAGKSSILIAISVATGQSYTERSRKLADLIRRGKDTARVTLVLDNRAENGKRPVPYINNDIISVSRYLKKDGTYWFEINGRQVSKFDVNRLFKGVGMNPDNMLIIMHQNMIEEFAITSPEEKLRMVEEAVGFSQYRRAIYESEERLNRILGEEEATSQLLASAEQTLAYWKELNDKYNEKKSLLERKAYLERELIWAQILKNERAVAQIEEKIRLKSSQLEAIEKGIRTKSEEAGALWGEYLLLKEKFRTLLLGVKNGEAVLKELGLVDERLDEVVKKYVELRIDEAVMRYRKGELERELKELRSSLEEARAALMESEKFKDKAGERIETTRTLLEISDEIKFVNAHLLSLGDVPEDAPSMYQAYLKTYNELKQKAEVVGENRRKTIEELEERKRVWRGVMEKLIEEINPTYRSVLGRVGGTGAIRLLNMDDPDRAGVEITVGFRGTSPVLLDAYSQSGGERAVATMAFLLALQDHLKSPVRAVDEFDVHMDPHNRESMMRMLFSFMNDSSDVQFIVITPSQLTAVGEFANIIFVQNVHGRSEVAKAAAASA
ncbi:MAG: AAA family ATPase [Candidatus Verstraetearchaeota archaeon]|jgi:chromosome segregation ATPase|nr:AAA family ATPase [Candidatus Verstraetearchaeota archaeon]